MTVEGFKNQGSYTPDNLIAGEYPRVERLVTITGGAALAMGSVLGKITANGKYQLSVLADSDGSQTPEVILAEAADATSADVQGIVYFAGEFNENTLTFGTGHTADNTRDGLRSKSIFLRKNQAI